MGISIALVLCVCVCVCVCVCACARMRACLYFSTLPCLTVEIILETE